MQGSVPHAERLPLNRSAEFVGQVKETRYHDAVCYFVYCAQADEQVLCAIAAHAGTGVP
jgi:phosphoribosylformylglycinamidine (FGAM) synthase-like amidotransferase family enzyme